MATEMTAIKTVKSTKLITKLFLFRSESTVFIILKAEICGRSAKIT